MRDSEQENATHTASDESSVRADEPKSCANCGVAIDTEEWHPLVTRTDPGGNFRLYAFCDENCRNEWDEN